MSNGRKGWVCINSFMRSSLIGVIYTLRGRDKPRFSCAELATHGLFDRSDFGVQSSGLSAAPVHFYGAGDSVGVFGELHVALLDNGHDGGPFAFDAGAQGA